MFSHPEDLDDFSSGYFIGLLVGEGHFGGDGRQPQITVKMHVRHEQIFQWLARTFPGGALYGPYTHDRRIYYMWLVRGPYLRRFVAPFVHRRRAWLDDHVYGRFAAMCARYRIDLTDYPTAASQGEALTGGATPLPEFEGEPIGELPPDDVVGGASTRPAVAGAAPRAVRPPAAPPAPP